MIFFFRHGTQSLTLNKFIPDIVNLLSDPTATVRDTAFSTLVDLYKHVGDKLRIDLQKRNIVPQSKWPTLSQRFDEAKARGELLPSASKSDCKYLHILMYIQRYLTPKQTVETFDTCFNEKVIMFIEEIN